MPSSRDGNALFFHFKHVRTICRSALINRYIKQRTDDNVYLSHLKGTVFCNINIVTKTLAAKVKADDKLYRN